MHGNYVVPKTEEICGLALQLHCAPILFGRIVPENLKNNFPHRWIEE
jgi:hypothetical protein